MEAAPNSGTGPNPTPTPPTRSPAAGPIGPLLGLLRRVDGWVAMLEQIQLVGAVAIMLCFVAINIALRWSGRQLLPWAYELARFMMLWVALLGASLATRRRRHITIDVITKSLHPRLKGSLSVFTNVFSSFLCGYLAVVAGHYLLATREDGLTSLSLHLPFWTVQIIMPTGLGVMSARFLLCALEDVNAQFTGDFRHLETHEVPGAPT